MDMKDTFYDLSAKAIDGEESSFEEYRGKAVLVVNTASKCGFTPQFEGLQKLYDTFRERGFEILGFPCNQFANQEPGDAESIKHGCMLDYGVTFPMFAKVDVNGENAHPVFRWLRERFGGFGKKRVKWNFTKFLIDREGKPVKRYAPTVRPEAIEKTIAELLDR